MVAHGPKSRGPTEPARGNTLAHHQRESEVTLATWNEKKNNKPKKLARPKSLAEEKLRQNYVSYVE